MARFVFKLQPLLEARRRVEREAQLAVAELERHRLNLEAQLRRSQEAITHSKQELREELTGTLHAPQLRLYAGAALNYVRQAQRMAVELAGIHSRLEAARAVLAEAVRHRRAIELLRERRLDAWRRRMERAEAGAHDELAMIAAARKEIES